MPYDEYGYAIRKNKTAIKRDLLKLRDMGKEIIALNPEQIDSLPIADKLKQETLSAKKMQKNALRRQLVYIEKLMREEDGELIRQALDELAMPHQEDVELFHQLEQWRDQLLENDNALIESLVNTYPGLERQTLRQHIRNASKEKSQNKPPKSSRILFKYLRENVDHL